MLVFNLSPRIIRSLIYVTVVNFAVVALFYWSQVDSALLGFTRPTLALYGLIATALSFQMTWPQGKATAGYLFLILALAALLEASLRSGHAIERRELLALLVCPLFPAVFVVIETDDWGHVPVVKMIKAAILVIVAWIYVIATVAAQSEIGWVNYLYEFLSINSLAVLVIYAVSPILNAGGGADTSVRRG